jgi:hypothetical protein
MGARSTYSTLSVNRVSGNRQSLGVAFHGDDVAVKNQRTSLATDFFFLYVFSYIVVVMEILAARRVPGCRQTYSVLHGIK